MMPSLLWVAALSVVGLLEEAIDLYTLLLFFYCLIKIVRMLRTEKNIEKCSLRLIVDLSSHKLFYRK